jgi:hypothetical protein
MTKLLAAFLIVGSFSLAHADESKMKIEMPTGGETRQVAQAEDVVRPESLKYDSAEYKKHKEYLKFIDRHYNK